MSPRPSRTARELLRLYSLARSGEDNLGHFLRERPELVHHLGAALDLHRDDAEIALQLAPAVGRYKRRAGRAQAEERAERAARAVQQLVATARHRHELVELDADLLLADVLADASRKYISFEMPGARIPVYRHALAKARVPLRGFIDLAGYVDERGLHLRWRGGRGGLDFRPQAEQRDAEVLHVDLRPAPPVRRMLPRPVLLADVLADLGLT